MNVIEQTRQFTSEEVIKLSYYVDDPTRKAAYESIKVDDLRKELNERFLPTFKGQKKADLILALLVDDLSQADMLDIAAERLQKQQRFLSSQSSTTSDLRVATIQDQPSAPLSFMGVPAEIRLRIYHFAIPHNQTLTNTVKSPMAKVKLINMRDKGMPTGRVSVYTESMSETALLRTCKVIRKEAYALYYSRQSYHFERHETLDQKFALTQWIKNSKPEYAPDPRATLEAWLQKLGVDRIKKVRSMVIGLNIDNVWVTFRLTGDTLSAVVRMDHEASTHVYEEVLQRKYGQVKAQLEKIMGGRTLQEPKSRPAVCKRKAD